MQATFTQLGAKIVFPFFVFVCLVACDLKLPDMGLPMLASAPVDTTDRSATIEWDAPTTRVDDSSLTDLAGFRVYRKFSSEDDLCTDPSEILPIPDPMTVQVTFTGLEPGFHFFRVMALDSEGTESVCSEVVSKEIK